MSCSFLKYVIIGSNDLKAFTVRKRCNSPTINRMRRGGRIRYWLFIIVYIIFYPSIQDLFDFDQKRNRDIVCSYFDAALKVFALSDMSVHDNPLRLNLRNSTRKACTVNPCVSSRWTVLVNVQVNKQTIINKQTIMFWHFLGQGMRHYLFHGGYTRDWQN